MATMEAAAAASAVAAAVVAVEVEPSEVQQALPERTLAAAPVVQVLSALAFPAGAGA
jgi:hypothetical protein